MSAPHKPWPDMTAAEKTEAIRSYPSSMISKVVAQKLSTPEHPVSAAAVIGHCRRHGVFERQNGGFGLVAHNSTRAQRARLEKAIKAGDACASRAPARKGVAAGAEDCPPDGDQEAGAATVRLSAEDKLLKMTSQRPDGVGIDFFALTHAACRWPLFGDDAAFAEQRYCGAQREHGAYCKAHGRLAFVPPEKREKKRKPYAQRRAAEAVAP